MRSSGNTAMQARATLGLVFGIGAIAVGGRAFSHRQVLQDPPAAEHHAHIRSAVGAELMQEMQRTLGGQRSASTMVSTTAADLLEALDSAGVERALVLSIAYMFGRPDLVVENEYAKVQAENDYVAAQVATAPDRLIGACSVNPLADYALEEIGRCARDPRLHALKLHLANSNVDLSDDTHVQRLASVFELIGRLGLPAVVHVRPSEDYGAEHARIFIDDVLSQAPDLPVQIAHMAGWGGYDAATDAALEAFTQALAEHRLDPERITFDLGAVVFQPEAAGSDTALARRVREANQQLAERIRELGVERVVFATDWPSWPPMQDPAMKIARNARLLEEALPLDPAELAQLFANDAILGRY